MWKHPILLVTQFRHPLYLFCLHKSEQLHTSKWYLKESTNKHNLLVKRDKRLNITHFRRAYVTTLDFKETWTFIETFVNHNVWENFMSSSALASLWDLTKIQVKVKFRNWTKWYDMFNQILVVDLVCYGWGYNWWHLFPCN